MKIVLANNLFEPYNKGGAEKVVKEMAKNFLADGHEVVIITTKAKVEKERKINPNNNFKVYQVPSSYYNLNKFSKPRRFFWHLNSFCNPKKRNIYQKILKQEKPDLLITHNLVGLGFFLISIANNLKIRHEHFLHDIQLLHPSGLLLLGQEKNLNSPIAKIYQSLTKKYFKNTNKIISPSNWLLKEHLNRAFFMQQEKEIRRLKKVIFSNQIKERGGNNFLFVGQLEKHKGIDFLINTFYEFKKESATLTIIGSGQEQVLVEKAILKDKRINYLGFLETKAIKEEMEKADALIVPSLCYENSPTVIYEANEINLKVIASEIGGIPEIIKNNDSLFKAGDKEDLLKKLNENSTNY